MARRRPFRCIVAAGAGLAVLAVVGCGATDRSTDAGTGALTDETSPPFTVGTSPATDTKPLLELVDVCYGGCGAVAPGSLPTVVVYPDGTIVRSGYQSVTGDPQRALAGYEGRLDDATLASLVAEARAADLALGGVGVNGSVGGSADGGGTRFVARLDGMQTSFEVPGLGSASDEAAGTDGGTGDVVQRGALAVVADHLRALGTQVAATPRRGARWVVVAAPADPATSTGSSTVAWSSPDPASLDAPAGLVSEAPALGLVTATPLRCGLLEVGDGRVDELSTAPAGWLRARVGGALWVLGARPLLPHEHTCADVAASVADQHLVDLADLRGR